MRRAILAAVAAILGLGAAIFLFAPEPSDTLQQVRSRGTLICGVSSSIKPFGYLDPASRELVGYDVDFCRAVAEHIGVRAQPMAVSVEQRIPELNAGRIDLLVSVLGWTPERARQIDYSHSYFVSRQVVIVPHGSDIRDLAELANRRVSAAKGSTGEQYLRVKVPGAAVLTFQDAPSAFLAFEQGKVDAMVLSDLAAMQLRQESGSDFATIRQPIAIETWGLGVRKGEKALLHQVNAALTEMEVKGQAEAIFTKWFGPGTEFAQSRTFKVQPIANGDQAAEQTDGTLLDLLKAPYPGWLWQGFLTTLHLTGLSWVLAFAIAMLLTGLRMSRVVPLQWFVSTYVEFSRNIPLLVQVMFWYFAMPSLLPDGAQLWLQNHNSEFVLATCALGFCLAGYFAESIRSGIRAIPNGQEEAARALGFGGVKTLRFIIIPQAIRLSLPPLMNNTLLLFQNSSIALAIGVHELMYQTRAIENETYRTVAIFALATLMYFSVSLLLMFQAARVERRLAKR
ncbi:hypothetical protein GCM10011494_36960 [Novosphingobium endophyticum]|uniref:ABC transmembrane type-1 domain-containing protein n=1 Tax=Novosphingobium endophyticum TaxID=1955250 RepID=A0A916TVT6_9SPHN|nr:ABC transporter permease subunit [Novosphingobium endophyticum]GGC14742.1 hypothetical protein GCM10011494_36960 [Novosphingobium endophyticum]